LTAEEKTIVDNATVIPEGSPSEPHPREYIEVKDDR
jgi:hypothetical protein